MIEKAKTFLCISLGVLCLAVAYNLIATPLIAQGKSKKAEVVGITSTQQGFVFVVDEAGNLYSAYQSRAGRILRHWGNLPEESLPMQVPIK